MIPKMKINKVVGGYHVKGDDTSKTYILLDSIKDGEVLGKRIEYASFDTPNRYTVYYQFMRMGSFRTLKEAKQFIADNP